MSNRIEGLVDRWTTTPRREVDIMNAPGEPGAFIRSVNIDRAGRRVLRPDDVLRAVGEGLDHLVRHIVVELDRR